jgi:hypothetical protein
MTISAKFSFSQPSSFTDKDFKLTDDRHQVMATAHMSLQIRCPKNVTSERNKERRNSLWFEQYFINIYKQHMLGHLKSTSIYNINIYILYGGQVNNRYYHNFITAEKVMHLFSNLKFCVRKARFFFFLEIW